MDKVERGNRAKALLKDTTFNEALDALSARYVATFGQSGTSNEDVLKAHSKLVLLSELRTELQSFAYDADVAQKKGSAPS